MTIYMKRMAANRPQLCGMLLACAVLCLTPVNAQAGVVWEQGFESDTAGWSDGAPFGAISQVASGTDGINSATGAGHAVVTQTPAQSAPYSFFDGSRSSWPGEYTASIDIYLDTTWATGEGFDYSVSTSDSSGGFLRDFIFHVTQDTTPGGLLVGGSNNSNFDPIETLEMGNHYNVAFSGWYTFQHHFYDNGGVLAVDLNLLDSGGTNLFTETRTTASDLIPSVVGGNRYSWFTNIDITGGIAIDNHRLDIAAVPEPASLLTFGALGLCATVGGRRKLRKRRLQQQA